MDKEWRFVANKISDYDALILAGGHVPTQNKYFEFSHRHPIQNSVIRPNQRQTTLAFPPCICYNFITWFCSL